MLRWVGGISLFLTACRYTPAPDQPIDGGTDAPGDTPVDLDTPMDTTPKPYVGYDDATTEGTAGFYIFAPHGTSSDMSMFPGTFFDFGTTRVSVDAVDIDCDVTGPTEGTLVANLKVVIVGTAPNLKYQMAKNTSGIGSGLVEGNCYRFKPTLDGVALGYTDLQVTSGTPPTPFHRATPGSNLTIKFRTEGSLDVN